MRHRVRREQSAFLHTNERVARVTTTDEETILYDGAAGKLAATHAGSGNFAVIEETGEDFNFGLLINEIGDHSGTVPLSACPSVIVVNADGEWTLKAE